MTTAQSNYQFHPFLAFPNKLGYGGFTPSSCYINDLYIDLIVKVRPILDQCISNLPGRILKWDHSFKV